MKNYDKLERIIFLLYKPILMLDGINKALKLNRYQCLGIKEYSKIDAVKKCFQILS